VTSKRSVSFAKKCVILRDLRVKLRPNVADRTCSVVGRVCGSGGGLLRETLVAIVGSNCGNNIGKLQTQKQRTYPNLYECPYWNVGVEMAHLVGLLVILLCCLFQAICVETDDSKFRDAAQFVLDTFNRQPDSPYVYDSAKIINVYSKVRNVFVLKTVKVETKVCSYTSKGQ
jgi:predicted RNA-binding Zn-ribbon protein involved in translation (DUF1610 family)